MAFSAFERQIDGHRKTGGSYVNGDWVEAVPTDISVMSSVQPSPNKDLMLLPEGRREGGAYSLYSTSELRNGDVYFLYGDAYEVLAVEVWQNGILPHYKAVAARMQKEGSL